MEDYDKVECGLYLCLTIIKVAATLLVRAREELAALCRGRSLPQPKPGPAPRVLPLAGIAQYHSNNGSVRQSGSGPLLRRWLHLHLGRLRAAVRRSRADPAGSRGAASPPSLRAGREHVCRTLDRPMP